MTVPVRVDFFLSTPLCIGDYEHIHFDGVLAHLRSRYNNPTEYRKRHSRKAEPQTSGGMRVLHYRNLYHASVGLLDGEIPNPHQPRHNVLETDMTIYKRFDDVSMFKPDIANLSKWTPAIGSGAYRNNMIKLNILDIRFVRFYARVDIELLKKLLDGLHSLGKKTAIGYGQIKSYEIKEIKEDISVVHRGKAMRYIPQEFLNSWELLESRAWRPPYWDVHNRAKCAPPGSEVSMKSNTSMSPKYR